MGEDLHTAFELMVDDQKALAYLNLKPNKLIAVLNDLQTKGTELGYAKIVHNPHNDTYAVNGRQCNSKTCAIAYIAARWH